MMDFSMLWKDLAHRLPHRRRAGAFVPDAAWQRAVLSNGATARRAAGRRTRWSGPVIAMLSFVCSIGNVPMAAILWASGISFGGVLAFLYADLIVLPLLDVYRKYYGCPHGGVYLRCVLRDDGDLGDRDGRRVLGAASRSGAEPERRARYLTTFSFNYTFWLNLAFGALAIYLWSVNAAIRWNTGAARHEAA